MAYAVPIACGVIFFGESPLGTPLRMLRCIGFAAVVIGAVVLAGSRAPDGDGATVASNLSDQPAPGPAGSVGEAT